MKYIDVKRFWPFGTIIAVVFVLFILPSAFTLPDWLANTRAELVILLIFTSSVAFTSGLSSNKVGQSTVLLLSGIAVQSSFAVLASSEPTNCASVAREPLELLVGLVGVFSILPWQVIFTLVGAPFLVYYRMARLSKFHRALVTLSILVVIGAEFWIVGAHTPPGKCTWF